MPEVILVRSLTTCTTDKDSKVFTKESLPVPWYFIVYWYQWKRVGLVILWHECLKKIKISGVVVLFHLFIKNFAEKLVHVHRWILKCACHGKVPSLLRDVRLRGGLKIRCYSAIFNRKIVNRLSESVSLSERFIQRNVLSSNTF